MACPSDDGRITRAVAQESLAMRGIDENGLDEVDRTPRGRVATPRAYEYFNREAPRRQPRLF